MTSTSQETTGMNISGRKLEKLLKLIKIRRWYKAPSFIAHLSLWAEITPYRCCYL